MIISAYVGLRAIGWMVHSANEIIQYGIKRLHVPFDNYYEYISGLPVSKRINRRMKRQARRNLWRYKSRRNNLKHYLQNQLHSEGLTLIREDHLKLRVKALSEKVSNDELVTILLQLQLKRGYKSLRGVSDNENSDYLKEIETHENNLKGCRSIAEYLLTLPTSKNIIFTRQSYINEFNAIMDKQNIADDVRKKIYNLIYFQNPLKKGKIGKCDYEPNRTVIHGSHPLYQQFRCWRDAMNIVIWDGDKNEVEISFEQRKKWVDKLMTGANITKASCCKDLGYKKSTQLSWLSGKQLSGNPIAVFDKLGIDADAETLWQELFSATDNDRLRIFLQSKYGFEDYIIDELIDLDFDKMGHGEFSAKAIRKLLPLMQSGMKLKHAILEVYGKVDFKNVELRNVILEQHYDAYKSLVEGLKKKYPAVEQIKFEIDPLLKAGNKLRKSMSQAKRKEEKIIKEHGHLFKSGSPSYNAKKFRIWEESDGISPYEPGYKIPLEKLFTDKYNFDHIVAKSKLMEGGESNLLLCPVKLNEEKNNHITGIEYAEQLGILDKWKEIAEKMPAGKQQYMNMRSNEVPLNHVSSRQNSDYNTKCFSTIGNGLNIPNKIINKFIQVWRLNEYSDQDARQALCKAYIVANFCQQTVDYFDKIKDAGHDPYGLIASYDVPDIEHAPVSMQRIKFTRKTKYGYTPRFALHGESVHGKRVKKYRNGKGEWKEDVFYKIRQSVSKLTAPMVEKIMDESLKRKIKQRIAEKGNHDDGITSLVESPVTHDGNPVRSVSIIVNAEKIYPLHSNREDKQKNIDYVFSDKAHRLVLKAGEKGKMLKESVPLMQFVDGLNAGLEMRGQGFELQERNIVELRGVKYFVIGAGADMSLRPVYTLSATDTCKVKADDWKMMNKLLVNQFGELKVTVPVWTETKTEEPTLFD